MNYQSDILIDKIWSIDLIKFLHRSSWQDEDFGCTHLTKSPKRSLKILCYKKLKKKNVTWTNTSSVRANRHEYLIFPPKQSFFVITYDHLWSFAITPLKRGLPKEWSTPWRSAGRDADFSVLYFFWYIYLVPIKLANTFVDFQCCHFLRKLKITPPIIQKVVRQKFENQKSEMYKIFIFSRRTLWNVNFFLETLFKGSKSPSEKFKQNIKMFCKNLGIKMKNEKSDLIPYKNKLYMILKNYTWLVARY